MGLYKLEGSRLAEYPVHDFGAENYEERIEAILEENPQTLFESEPVIWIGRQVSTSYGNIADLIGLDSQGSGVVVELKRGTTPRDIVAQVLEYTTWLSRLDENDINELAMKYWRTRGTNYASLDEAFINVFDIEANDIPYINLSQKTVIIGQEISPEVKDVVHYLRDHGLDIYCWKFTYHVNKNGEEMLRTDIEVGGEPPGSKLEVSRVSPSPARALNRSIVQKAVEELNKKFADNLDLLIHPFKVFQALRAESAAAYIDFSYGDANLALFAYFDQKEIYIEVFALRKHGVSAVLALYEDFLKPELGDYLSFDQAEKRPIWYEESLEMIESNDDKLAVFVKASAKVAQVIISAIKNQ